MEPPPSRHTIASAPREASIPNARPRCTGEARGHKLLRSACPDSKGRRSHLTFQDRHEQQQECEDQHGPYHVQVSGFERYSLGHRTNLPSAVIIADTEHDATAHSIYLPRPRPGQKKAPRGYGAGPTMDLCLWVGTGDRAVSDRRRFVLNSRGILCFLPVNPSSAV